MIKYLHTRQHRYLLLPLIIFLFLGVSYGQTTTPGSEDIRNFAILSSELINLLNRVRVILANMAGKLMTNTLVYAEFIHLDKYLRQLRNISKNFANFALGFIFLIWILRAIFDNNNNTSDKIGKKIGYLLIAAIGIQSSWFLVGALIDIEKIASSAIASLPSIIIAQDSNIRNTIINGPFGRDIHTKLKLTYDKSSTYKSFKIEPEQNTNTNNIQSDEIFDAISPRYDSISWPLIFMGMGVLQIQNYHLTSIQANPNRNDLSTDLVIKLLTALFFSLMLAVLIIINFFRIAYLRIIIALSPFIMLFLVMKDLLNISNLEESIPFPVKIKQIISLIFQPTIVIWLISIGMIALMAMYSAINSGKIIENSNAYQACLANTFCFDMQGFTYTIRDIIMRILALLILLAIVRMSGKMIGSSNNIINGLINQVATLPSRVAMLPIITRANAVKQAIQDTTWVNLTTNKISSGLTLDNKAREALGLWSSRQTAPKNANQYIEELKKSNTWYEFIGKANYRYNDPNISNKNIVTAIKNNNDLKQKFIDLYNKQENKSAKAKLVLKDPKNKNKEISQIDLNGNTSPSIDDLLNDGENIKAIETTIKSFKP
jgi:hypothetical protein